MYEEINEPIETATRFKGGQAEPLAFRWHHSIFKISKVNLCHKFCTGKDIIYSYSVSTDNGDNFKISFNPNALIWTLDQIYELNHE